MILMSSDGSPRTSPEYSCAYVPDESIGEIIDTTRLTRSKSRNYQPFNLIKFALFVEPLTVKQALGQEDFIPFQKHVDQSRLVAKEYNQVCRVDYKLLASLSCEESSSYITNGRRDVPSSRHERGDLHVITGRLR